LWCFSCVAARGGVVVVGWDQDVVGVTGVVGLRSIVGGGGGVVAGNIVACVDVGWRPAASVRGHRVAIGGVVIG
jgi:hypothetical protein